MSATNATLPSEEYQGEALDELFDVLADWRRRVVVEELAREGPTDVEALAAQIAHVGGARSASAAQIELVHTHLPRLAAADVIRHDRDGGRCELAETEAAAAFEALLAAARRAP